MEFPYLSPSGKKVWIPEANRQAAEAKGYRPDDGTSDQPVRAALEGVARTATLGLSDKALVAAELADPSQLKGRRENSPTASFLGELGGGFVPGVGSVSKVIGGVKGFVVEGGLMGFSSVMTESVLNNTELTGQRVAAGITGGALGGGILGTGSKAIGFGLGKIADAASPLVAKLGSKSAKELLEAGAAKVEKLALLDDAGKRLLEKAQTEYPHGLAIDDAIDFGRKAGAISPGSSFDKPALDLIDNRINEVGKNIGGYLSRMEAADPFSTVAELKVVAAMKAALDKYRKNSAFDAAVKRGEREIENFIAKPKRTWQDVWDTQSSLRQNQSVSSLDATNTKDVVENLRLSMRDAVMEASNKLAPGSREAFHKLVKERAAGELMKDLFENRIYKSGHVGLKDMGMAMLFSNGNPVAAGAVLGAKHFMDKRGGFIASAAMRKLADSGLMERVADQFHKRTQQVLATAPEMLGPFRMQIERAFSDGALSLMQTHTALASSAQGDNYLSRMGLTRETPEEESGVSQKMSLLTAMMDADAVAQDETTAAVEGFFQRGAGRPPKESYITAKQFDAKFKSLEAMMRDPQLAMEQIPPQLMGAAPATAGQAAASVMNGVAYLYEKAPKSPWAGMPESLQQPWEPSRAELARWNRSVQAVEDPNSVMRLMSNGTATEEHIRALQTVYPAIYADIQEKLVEKLMDVKAKVPYSKRAALAMILGPQALGMSQQQVMILQEAHAKVGQQEQGQPGSKPDGRQKVDQERNMNTQSQRLEGRNQGVS